MTRGDMKESIRYALGLREPEEQPMIEREIHRGILDVLRRTGCYFQCINADVPDDQSRIEFAAGGPIMRAVYILRGNRPMYRVTFDVLAYGARDSFAQLGQILFFTVKFLPGEQLQLYAVPRVGPMTDDAQLLEDEQWGGIPEEFQDAVELYACAKLGSRATDGASSLGMKYLQEYVGSDGRSGRIADIKRQVNTMSGRMLGPAQLLYVPNGRKRSYYTQAYVT